MVTTSTGAEPDAPTFTERYVAPIQQATRKHSPHILLAVAGATVALAPPPFSCLGVAALILAVRK